MPAAGKSPELAGGEAAGPPRLYNYLFIIYSLHSPYPSLAIARTLHMQESCRSNTVNTEQHTTTCTTDWLSQGLSRHTFPECRRGCKSVQSKTSMASESSRLKIINNTENCADSLWSTSAPEFRGCSDQPSQSSYTLHSCLVNSGDNAWMLICF